MVLFYAKRNPNPYFRPKRGEVFLMSIFMVLLSGGFSFMLATLFESDINLQKAKQDAQEALGGNAPAGNDESTGALGGRSGGGSAPKPDPSLPPFLQK